MTVSKHVTVTPSDPSVPATIQNYHSHKHVNQPVVYPYKPPAKSDPPGAHLYKQAWAISKIATQAIIFYAEPATYTLGLVVGALEAGRKWSEFGPPKQIDSDSEMKDFGATAHTSTLWSLISIFLMNAFGASLPAVINTVSPQHQDSISRIAPHIIDTATEEEKDYFRRKLGQNYTLPSSEAQWLKHAYILYQAIMTGEELVGRFAKWIDVSEQKSK